MLQHFVAVSTCLYTRLKLVSFLRESRELYFHKGGARNLKQEILSILPSYNSQNGLGVPMKVKVILNGHALIMHISIPMYGRVSPLNAEWL